MNIIFWIEETKKTTYFWKSLSELGGSCPFEARPIGIRRTDENLIKYFISFNEENIYDFSDFYNFYNPDGILENFLNLFAIKFRPQWNFEPVKVKTAFSIVNHQPPEQNNFVEVTDNRIW